MRRPSGAWPPTGTTSSLAPFDPAGTVTLDKLPGAFWIQALSVRVFGYHTWAIVLPQVVEGILSVLFLYRAVNRLRGTTAALVAAFILAASPATVGLNRGNIADTAMTLFLVLAADAISMALVSGRQRYLVYAGIWVGIAFQAKMLEAWLVLPAFGLAYLFGREDRWGHKIRQVVVAGLVAAVVSLSWMTIVTLTPAHDRPYVDGSQNNSVFQQVFVYDGFGRSGQQPAFQEFLGGIHLSPEVLNGPSPAWNRLVQGELGRDTGWLLPAALAIGVGGLFTRRRSYFILWTGWLVPMVLVFSDVFIMHAYYTAALSPPIAAILGAGIAGLWESRAESRPVAMRRCGVTGSGCGRHGRLRNLVDPIVGRYRADLVGTPGDIHRCRGCPALGSLGRRLVPTMAPRPGADHRNRGHPGDPNFGSRPTRTAIIKGSRTPRSSRRRRRRNTPPSSDCHRRRGPGPSSRSSRSSRWDLPTSWPSTRQRLPRSSSSASGKEFLPIGGFTGSIPEPTINQLESMIRAGKFHLVLLTGGHDPRLTWIAHHCQHLGPGGGSVGLFTCQPADARDIG